MNIIPRIPEGKTRPCCAGPNAIRLLACTLRLQPRVFSRWGLEDLAPDWLPSAGELSLIQHTPGIDMSSGSWGKGFLRQSAWHCQRKTDAMTAIPCHYTLLGDGEIQKDQVWRGFHVRRPSHSLWTILWSL